MKILLIFFLLIPSLVDAAPPETLIPMGTYAVGSYVLTSASLASETQFTFQIDRQFWTNPAVTLTILAETSSDNGKTYAERCAATSIGGVLTDLNGNTLSTTTISCSLPSDIGTKRVRLTAIIAGGSLTASGVLLTK